MGGQVLTCRDLYAGLVFFRRISAVDPLSPFLYDKIGQHVCVAPHRLSPVLIVDFPPVYRHPG